MQIKVIVQQFVLLAYLLLTKSFVDLGNILIVPPFWERFLKVRSVVEIWAVVRKIINLMVQRIVYWFVTTLVAYCATCCGLWAYWLHGLDQIWVVIRSLSIHTWCHGFGWLVKALLRILMLFLCVHLSWYPKNTSLIGKVGIIIGGKFLRLYVSSPEMVLPEDTQIVRSRKILPLILILQTLDIGHL